MKKILARILICVMVLGLVQIGNTAGTAKAASTDADIYYAVHCQTYGWGLGVAKNGEEPVHLDRRNVWSLSRSG